MLIDSNKELREKVREELKEEIDKEKQQIIMKQEREKMLKEMEWELKSPFEKAQHFANGFLNGISKFDMNKKKVKKK